MAIPGLLIEYLINGALALVWMYPVILRYNGLSKIDPFYLPLFILCLYFLGMIVDFAAWIITKPFKQSVRKWIEEKNHFDPKDFSSSSHERQAKFAIYAPELLKEIGMRSSRDRIARGGIINSISITIVSFALHFDLYLSVIGCCLIVITFVMWAAFEQVSYGYELNAEKILDLKLLNENKTSGG